MLERFLKNHVLANLLFVLVLVIGFLNYNLLPREQDPEINFNWIVITVIYPGASAIDVEKRVVNPIEDAIRGIGDIDFVSSNCRESVASMLIRFDAIDSATFDKRVNDLRGEIRNIESELPDAASSPNILEVTSSNAFPSATVVVTSLANDEVLRSQARNIKKDIERIKNVDRVDARALHDPELQVRFDATKLEAFNVSPIDISQTVSSFFQDAAAGRVDVDSENWLIRLIGTNNSPDALAKLPILGKNNEVLLGDVARIVKTRERAQELVSYDSQPAVLLAVMKKGHSNTLDLVEDIKTYIAQRNKLTSSTGVNLILIDDQSVITGEAINVMQTNALIGLCFVLFVTWIFLGSKIAFLTTIGIPFILAGTFWALNAFNQTLNVSVLLAVVISLGMLVDDAVVVVEAIYYRLQRGQHSYSAVTAALHEVFAPVTTAVLTTMAAFLPLMLLPGILGDFMKVIPMVVTIALAISLIEAYWMLPAHIMGMKINFKKISNTQKLRVRYTHLLQIKYTQLLIKVLRYPVRALTVVILLFVFAITTVSLGFIKMDFFASDPLRLFYVNIEMTPATPLEKTMQKANAIEQVVRKHVHEGEARGITSYAGIQFTETAPKIGDNYAQILIGLNPKKDGLRDVETMIESMRNAIEHYPGTVNVSFLKLAGGPPTAKPISVKVRGDDYEELKSAATTIQEILKQHKSIMDISDDANRGRQELILKPDHDAIIRNGLDPAVIARNLRLFADGEIVASMQDQGEKLEVRVLAEKTSYQDINEVLDLTLPVNDSLTTTQRPIRLDELLVSSTETGLGNIRHYNFRRTITVEAGLDKTQLNELQANQYIREEWKKHADKYPNISLDFSGILDDIQESLASIQVLFLFGLGLMYLILGTQFRSYFQPLIIILASIPMAFTGVTIGLLITQNPLSLFTVYGVVALAGIAVNAAIVLISAANSRLKKGMSLHHAIIYAARRRVIPILITTLTTIAGLFSLAAGLGGSSLIWGPVATAIVWGLSFSSVLTLLVTPLIYLITMRYSHLVKT